MRDDRLPRIEVSALLDEALVAVASAGLAHVVGLRRADDDAETAAAFGGFDDERFGERFNDSRIEMRFG